MKYTTCKTLGLSLLLVAGMHLASCHSNTKTNANASDTVNSTTTNTAGDPMTNTANTPVQVAPDDALRNNLKDATKDYPGVTATVSNGEVTLTGNITRDKLPRLMAAINALHPKQIHQNMTVSK